MNVGLGVGIGFQQKKKAIVYDSFNRPDNASSLGNADTGQTWEYFGSSVWGIESGRAKIVTTGSTRDTALVTTTDSNISAQVIAVTTSSRLVIRAVDHQNCIFFGYASTAYSLYKNIAGTLTQLGQYTTTAVANDVLLVVANADSIKCYLNGIERIAVSETYNQTEKKHGMAGLNVAGRLFDNFIVEAV